MGTQHSVYNRNSFRDYFKLTRSEHALIKNLWVGIESNPQFHGHAFFTGFCELHPDYVKFYTLDPRLPLHFDTRSNAKFTMIMEALGYLLLDFFNKPKQLDRLVGYIAMSHKDMRLQKQDMFNFGYCLLDYLAQTFPSQMTPPCQDAITKYLTSIIDELSRKMDTFRDYEVMYGMKSTRRLRLLAGICLTTVSRDKVRKTMAYWSNRKREWDMRFIEWNTQNTTVEKRPVSSTEEDDTSAHKSKAEDDDVTTDAETSQRPLKYKSFRDNDQATSSNVIMKKSEFRQPTQTSLNGRRTVFRSEKDSVRNVDYERDNRDTAETMSSHMGQSQDSSVRSFYGETARERHRAQSLAREVVNPQSDGMVLRRRIRSSRVVVRPTAAQIAQLNADLDDDDDNDDDDDRFPIPEIKRRHSTTARQRRREGKRFSFDMK